jgi:signal peptidase II
VPPVEPVQQAPGEVRPKVLLLAAVAALIVALDAVSKALVVVNLTEGQPVHLLGDVFEFTLLRNPGAAWNLGTGYTAVFSALAIGVIVFVMRTARRLRSAGFAVAFGLLLGGAAGNLGDRIFRAPGIFRGNVVDWIGVVPRYYPVFNIADSAICIAGALFVLLALRGVHMDGTRGDHAVAGRPDAAPGDSASSEPAAPDSQSVTSEAGPPAPAEPGAPSPASQSSPAPRATSADAER